MALDVRLIVSEERKAWERSVGIPFLHPAADDPADDEQHWDQAPLDRTWAAVDGDRFVGNAAVFPRHVNLPGPAGGPCPVVPMAAITAVGVHPTHRRRGLLRRLMQAMLEDAVSRGEGVAGLQASEAGIYGRFGFGVATFAAERRIDPRRGGFLRPAPETQVRMLEPEEAEKVLPELFARTIARTPGQVDRTDGAWRYDVFQDLPAWRRGRSANFYAASDDGYVQYRSERTPDGARLHVRDVCATSPDAEAGLWRFLLDIDLVSEIVAHHRPVVEPLAFRLADPRALETTGVEDFLWLRVLDPAAMLSRRSYRAAGRLVLDVGAADAPLLDPDPAVGRWALDAGPDGATCRAATGSEPADLRLGVAELGTLLAGAASASTLAAAGRVEEVTAGALAAADVLFATDPVPFDTTGF